MDSSRKAELETKFQIARAGAPMTIEALRSATGALPDAVAVEVVAEGETIFLTFRDERPGARAVSLNPLAAIRLAAELAAIVASRFPILAPSTPAVPPPGPLH